MSIEKSNYKPEGWSYPRYLDFRRELELAAAEWFADKEKAVSTTRPYVLSRRSEWAHNIILPEVAEYIVAEKQRCQAISASFPLHKFVHHGLSSQAMLFNLVGPLIVYQDLDAIRPAFKNIEWPSGQVSGVFEVEDRNVFNERQAQPTSIDLVIRGPENRAFLFIEAKLVEQEFGTCSVFSDGDCDGQNPAKDFSLCYLHCVQRTYWTRLQALGFIRGAMKESPICPLANYYQFFREVVFALVKNGHFVLLCDERSPVFERSGIHGQRGLMPFLKTFVPDSLNSRVSTISIQTVVRAIKESGRHEQWIHEFERRYGIV